ncbi:MAG: glycosyltransferase family 2 protein [Clostridia bacterium]|nr:glycosyltransferase family 2 protein [Clostridia bacterium]
MQIYNYIDLAKDIIYVLSDLIVEIAAIAFLITIIYIRKRRKENNNRPIPFVRKNEPHYCLLVPARNESAVIEGLFKSLKNQVLPIASEDVYVIVESEDDPTCEIAKKYGHTVFVRKKLHLQRKGYALDECVKDIALKGKSYDAYFIIDADNILHPYFIYHMNKSFLAGYDIAIGYRDTKNGDENIVATCSSLTFPALNTFGNRIKIREGVNILISGTGMYVSGKYIEKIWKGYPFHSLTEDFELTMYSALNSMTSTYNEKALFYDEQPTKYRATIKQRLRWVRGFIDVRREYGKKLRKASKNKYSRNRGSQFAYGYSFYPYIWLIALGLFNFLSKIITSIASVISGRAFTLTDLGHFFGIFLLAYGVLFIFDGYLLYQERGKLSLSKKSKIKGMIAMPFFWFDYVPIFFMSLLKKEVKWDRIEHGNTKDKKK